MPRARRHAQPATPLAHTELEVVITDLVAEYLVRHHFRNEGKNAIEAVFSFPVPLDAAFLGMQATIAGDTLVATVQARRDAETNYDDAIAEGHSAVLLSAPEPGVLCISLGNLKPGETGEIELRFATALRVADRCARFSMPLVHRPRYGSWRLEDLETPTHDFAVEHPLSATIRVEGLLASAPVTCDTHAARFAQVGGRLELCIGQAQLDRDLVLTFELSQTLSPTARLIEDGESTLGLASVVLPVPDEAPKPLDLCLVLDGSGSMAGDAIVQSRQALLAVVDALCDDDRIQVLRFGTTTAQFFQRPMLATSRVRDSLRELAPTIEADLGGTELGQALERAIDHMGPEDGQRSGAIILVTDGAVQPRDIEQALAQAKKAHIRVFVVAVGSSAGAEVLGPLAEATHAVLERAVPAEPIDDCVMRQFRRARQGGAIELSVHWPASMATAIPMGSHYPGDAITLAAILPASAEGSVRIEAPTLGFSLSIPLAPRAPSPALRALIGQRRYQLSDNEVRARESLALHYGLLTRETAAVLVKHRADADRADGLPVILPVPQMVPEGMVAERASHSLASMSRKALSAFPCDHSYLEPPLFSRTGVRAGYVKPTKPRPERNKLGPARERVTLPAGYKPRPGEEYMNAYHLEYFRQRLLQWKDDLVEESKQTIENLKEEVRDVGDEAERTSRESENSLELRTRDRYRKLINRIDSALKRIEDGSYGYCVDTGEEIGLERLEARPTAERTIDAQERWESLQKWIGD